MKKKDNGKKKEMNQKEKILDVKETEKESNKSHDVLFNSLALRISAREKGRDGEKQLQVRWRYMEGRWCHGRWRGDNQNRCPS